MLNQRAVTVFNRIFSMLKRFNDDIPSPTVGAARRVLTHLCEYLNSPPCCRFFENTSITLSQLHQQINSKFDNVREIDRAKFGYVCTKIANLQLIAKISGRARRAGEGIGARRRLFTIAAAPAAETVEDIPTNTGR